MLLLPETVGADDLSTLLLGDFRPTATLRPTTENDDDSEFLRDRVAFVADVNGCRGLVDVAAGLDAIDGARTLEVAEQTDAVVVQSLRMLVRLADFDLANRLDWLAVVVVALEFAVLDGDFLEAPLWSTLAVVLDAFVVLLLLAECSLGDFGALISSAW